MKGNEFMKNVDENDANNSEFMKHMMYEMMGFDMDEIIKLVDVISNVFNRFKDNGLTEMQAMTLTMFFIKTSIDIANPAIKQG